MILNNYIVGDEQVYGLKTSESNISGKNRAGSVLLPTHAPHTRYYFAKQKQHEIIIELAKRLKSGFTSTGAYGMKALKKIEQCSRIINHYHNK